MNFTWSHNFNSKSESTEKIDYSAYSDDKLLDQFKMENWTKLQENEKVGIIQEMENRNARQQNREPSEVVSSSRITSYGSYNSMNNQMNINVNNFSSYETLDTFVHESNHAYQAYCIENGVGYDEYTRNMMEVETKRDENGNLYNYAKTSPQYDMQCNELDSNNKAARFLLAEPDRFKDDQEYRDYISERNAHFKDINYALDNYSQMRASMQNDQNYTSYIRGDITQEQYDALNKNINNSEFEDPTVVQSHSLENSISALDMEFSQENSLFSEENEENIEDFNNGIDNSNDEDNSVSY